MGRRTRGKSILECGAVALAAMTSLLAIGWALPTAADEVSSDTSPVEVPADSEEPPAADERSPGRFFDRDYLLEVWQRDELSGDWGGLRTKLGDHGIKAQFKFSQFGQGVASGGLRKNGTYGGKADYIVDVDLTKLVGLWPGLFFNVHAATQYGESSLIDAGPSLLPNTAMLLPLPNCRCTEITNIVIMQGLWEGTIPLQGDKGAAVVAAGKLDIVDLLTTNFPNFGHGLDGFLNFNSLYNVWNYLRFWFPAQYGASIALFNEDQGMPQATFLVYGQDNVSASWNISDSFSDGVGMMGFLRVFWDLGGKPGYAAVMASGSTKEYSVLDGIVWEPPNFPTLPPRPSLNVKMGNPWVVSPFLYQEFWHGEEGAKGERKAYVWLSASVSDKNPSFSRWSILTTVEALGLFDSRPLDRMGFAAWYTEFNEAYKDSFGIDEGNSYGFEMYYNLAISPWLHFTADLQLAQGINKGADFAVIPGARLVMNF
jgi:porin